MTSWSCSTPRSTSSSGSWISLGAWGASPYHLSRLFREVTGVTISQYRTRLRVHAVLDHFDAGDNNLAAIAADTGFSDHSHMTRTLTGVLGAKPSELRARLQARSPRIEEVAAHST